MCCPLPRVWTPACTSHPCTPEQADFSKGKDDSAVTQDGVCTGDFAFLGFVYLIICEVHGIFFNTISLPPPGWQQFSSDMTIWGLHRLHS